MKSLLLVVTCLALAACSDPEVTIEDASFTPSELGLKPVALVGSQNITRNQLDHALAFYSSNPMVNAEEGRIKVLNDMIEEQVMYNKALENGFDKSPEFINNQRKLLAYEYKQYLQKKVAENIKVNDLDLKIYYDENVKQYTKPSMSRLAIYLQRKDLPQQSKLTLKQIKEAAQYLKAEQGFGEYALDSHHSKTANRSGKLPWITQNSQLAGIPSEVLEASQSLSVGDVSSPITTEKGVYLVRLVNKKPQQVTAFEDVKASLRQQLVSDRKHQALQGFVKQAKQNMKIEIIKENLGKPGAVNTSTTKLGPPGFPVN